MSKIRLFFHLLFWTLLFCAGSSFGYFVVKSSDGIVRTIVIIIFAIPCLAMLFFGIFKCVINLSILCFGKKDFAVCISKSEQKYERDTGIDANKPIYYRMKYKVNGGKKTIKCLITICPCTKNIKSGDTIPIKRIGHLTYFDLSEQKKK